MSKKCNLFFTLHCSVAVGSNSTAATGNTSGMSTFNIHVYILRPVPTWPISVGRLQWDETIKHRGSQPTIIESGVESVNFAIVSAVSTTDSTADPVKIGLWVWAFIHVIC